MTSHDLSQQGPQAEPARQCVPRQSLGTSEDWQSLGTSEDWQSLGTSGDWQSLGTSGDRQSLPASTTSPRFRLPSLSELERRCQKPDHRRIGNWMARRITRPMALRVTRVVAPWGVSANAATLAAWGCGVAAAAAFAGGTVWGWVIGAALLQTWYLLDHVDGQLARLRGTASLDGAQLDYLMHHTVNLLVPLGVGFGLFAGAAEPLWLLGGLVWGIALLLITLQHDARYKAFIGRLKRVRGRLYVEGGGGARPVPQPPAPRRPARLAAWAARKACETHVITSALSMLAIGQLLLGDANLLAARVYLALMAPLAAMTAGWTLWRSQRRQSAEKEFAAWYRVPPGSCIVFSLGWWVVEPRHTAGVQEDGEIERSADGLPNGSPQPPPRRQRRRGAR